ncbi:MAG TPA: DUF4157 domain-containing protein [Actinomycetota bacterium]|nr:DUF4157 domain-containing protein [Actinomycetota bacterium]
MGAHDGAVAYASGSHIAFGPGQYQPASPRGRGVLAHELTHVLQQRNVGPAAGGGHEGEASRIGAVVAAGGRAPRIAAGLEPGAVARLADTAASPEAEPQGAKPKDAKPAPAQELRTPQDLARDVDEIHLALNSIRNREFVYRLLIRHHPHMRLFDEEYSHRHGRSLNGDFEQLGSPNDTRAMRYHEYGKLRPADKVYFALKDFGTDQDTLFWVLPEARTKETDDEFKKSYGGVFSNEGMLLDRKTPRRIAGAIRDETLLKIPDRDRALALLTYGSIVEDVDNVHFALHAVLRDPDMALAAIQRADRKTVRALYEQRWGMSLELEMRSLFNDAQLERAYVFLNPGISDEQRLIATVRLATTQVWLKPDSQVIFDAVEHASKEAKAALKAEIDRSLAKGPSSKPGGAREPKDGPLLTGIRDFFGGLNDADFARLNAMLMPEKEAPLPGGEAATPSAPVPAIPVPVPATDGDPNLGNDAARHLAAKGGVDKPSVFNQLKKATKEEVPVYAAAWTDTRDRRFGQYVLVRIDADQYKPVGKILAGTLDERIAFAIESGDEDYLTHLLTEFTDDDTKRTLWNDVAGFQSRVGATWSQGYLNKVLMLLKPSDLTPAEAVRWYESAIRREESWVDTVYERGVTQSRNTEFRELKGFAEKAGDGELSPSQAKEYKQRLENMQKAMDAYLAVRDRWEESIEQYAQLVMGLLTASLTAGITLEATLADVIVGVGKAALSNAFFKVATRKVVKGDRFQVMGEEGVQTFVTGAFEGGMNLFAPKFAERLMEAGLSKAGIEAMQIAAAGGARKAALEWSTKLTEGALTGAASSVVDSITRSETWKDGFGDGFEKVLTEAAGAVLTGARDVALVHGATKAAGGVVRGVGALGEKVGDRVERWTARRSGEPGPETEPAAGAAEPVAAVPKRRWVTDTESSSLDDALHGDPKSLRELLEGFSSWEEAVESLQEGHGIVAETPLGTRRALVRALWEHRETITRELHRKYGADTVKGSSNDPGSDKDVNFSGDNAGHNVLAAEAYLAGKYGSNWRKLYRMSLLVEAERVTGYLGETRALVLDPTMALKGIKLRAGIDVEAETLMLARQLRHTPPGRRAALLEEADPGIDRARARRLGDLTEGERIAVRDAALKEGDRLAAKHRHLTDPEEVADNGVAMAKQQMLVNAMEDDAYITPGAIRRFVQFGATPDLVHVEQAAREQLQMMAIHISHVGSLPAALRTYEFHKYMNSVVEVLSDTGVKGPPVPYLLHQTELLYRVFRKAAAAEGRPQGIETRHLASKWHLAGVRYTDIDVPIAAPSDAFLMDMWGMFKTVADRELPLLRKRAAIEEAETRETHLRDSGVLALGRHSTDTHEVSDFQGAATEAVGRHAAIFEDIPGIVKAHPRGEPSLWEQVGMPPEPGELLRASDWDAGVTVRHGWEGVPSGVLVQRALGGEFGPDVFIVTTGVEVSGNYHTSAELRQILVALAAGNNTSVTIHIKEGGSISTIPKGTSGVVGDALPGRLLLHLPPRFAQAGQVGRLLTEALPSAAEFDAFVRVHFPESAARMGAGMDLAARRKLLADRETENDLLRALRRDRGAFIDQVAELFPEAGQLERFMDDHFPLEAEGISQDLDDAARFRALVLWVGEEKVARALGTAGLHAPRPSKPPPAPEGKQGTMGDRELFRRQRAAALEGRGEGAHGEVVHLLAETLRLDSDFEAFVVTHFRELYVHMDTELSTSARREALVQRAGADAVLRALRTAPHPIHDLLLGLFPSAHSLDAFIEAKFPDVGAWIGEGVDNMSRISMLIHSAGQAAVIQAAVLSDTAAASVRQQERGGPLTGSREQRGTPSGVPPPGVKGTHEMEEAMQWGTTRGRRAADLTDRIAELTLEDLHKAGVTLAEAQWWRDRYFWMKENNPLNPATGKGNRAAPSRYALLQKAVILLGGR